MCALAAARTKLKKLKADEASKQATVDAASKNPMERSPHVKEVSPRVTEHCGGIAQSCLLGLQSDVSEES